MANKDEFGFDAVLADERKAVRTRRAKAHVGKSSAGPAGKESDAEDGLVGVACSGGGARSGSFSLGFLQSFYRHGLLRFVDYLSGVSGGGYPIAFLSQTICQSGHPIDWQRSTDSKNLAATTPDDDEKSRAVRLPIETAASGEQPKPIQELGQRLASMKQPMQYLSRHLWGLVTINLFVFSGLLAVGALAAWLMKQPDNPAHRSLLSEMSFRDDVSREMVPAVMFFIAWGLLYFVRSGIILLIGPQPQWRRRLAMFQKLTTGAYIMGVLTLILGVANILGSADIDITPTSRAFNVNPHVASWLTTARNWLTTGFGILFATAFVPYLNLKRLVRSGTNPASKPIERWSFQIVSNVIVFGLPLFAYFLLAAENVSRYQQQKPNQVLTATSIPDWSRFYSQVSLHRSPDRQKPIESSNPLTAGYARFSRWLKAELAAKGSLTAVVTSLWKPRNDAPPASDGHFFKEGELIPTGDLIWKVTGRDHDSLRSGVRSFSHPLEEIAALDQEIVHDDGAYGFLTRWRWALGSLLNRQGGLHDLVSRRNRRDLLQAQVISDINANILTNPTFYQTVKSLDVATRRKADALFNEVQRLKTWQIWDPIDDEVGPNFNRHPGEWLTGAHNAMDRIVEKAEAKSRALNSSSAVGDDELTRLRGERAGIQFVVSEIRKLNFDILARALDDGGALAVAKTDANTQAAALTPPLLLPLDSVFGRVVYDSDQKWRLQMAALCTAVFVVVGLIISLNTTSMHGYYRDHLGAIWCPADQFAPLSTLKPWLKGGPIPLWTGTLNRFSRREDPRGEKTSLFLLSPERCGCGAEEMDYIPTQDYGGDRITVSETLAISGAALTPALNYSLLVRAFLILTNSRLGQWLPTPVAGRNDAAWSAPLRILSDWLLHDPPQRAFCFVSDGGHSENLGIAALLERRCRLIIALDNGYDPNYQFLDLAKMLRMSESRYGVRFTSVDDPEKPLDLKPLRPVDKISGAHVILARIQYPAGADTNHAPEEGYLVYVKPSFTGDESASLILYREDQKEFPHDETIDQFFEPERFDAYRQLGEHIGDSVIRALWPEADRQRHPSAGTSKNILSEWKPKVGKPDEIQTIRECEIGLDSRDPAIRLKAAKFAESLSDEELRAIGLAHGVFQEALDHERRRGKAADKDVMASLNRTIDRIASLEARKQKPAPETSGKPAASE